jgi:RNA polymerase sigma-54 factor
MTNAPRLSARLVQSARLLQLSGPELETVIARELAENPALELSPRACRFELIASSSRTLPKDPPAPSGALDRLESDLRLSAPADVLPVATALLYSLDDHGYLLTPLAELAEEWCVDEAEIERGLQALRCLDVPGLAARDLRECLLLQCDYLAGRGVNCGLALRMLRDTWEDFVCQRWQALAGRLGVSPHEVEEARQFIVRNLYPYPLALVDGDSPAAPAARSDIVISAGEGRGDDEPALEGLRLRIPAAEALELQVSPAFLEPDLSRQDGKWAGAYIDKARQFIELVNRRWETLKSIGEQVILVQRDYLLGLSTQPAPLTRRTVAENIGLHESTVSRAISGKTVQLPSGRLVPLSAFFGASDLKASIDAILCAAADSRLSDRQISEALRGQGIVVARRTVAKYRRQGLPVKQFSVISR